VYVRPDLPGAKGTVSFAEPGATPQEPNDADWQALKARLNVIGGNQAQHLYRD
jgi:hypothetical protein